MARTLGREGFESLGLSLEAHSVIYGVGVFPVFRMTLKDGAVFDAAMKRIEEKGNLKPEMRDLGGVKYRYYQYRERASDCRRRYRQQPRRDCSDARCS